VSGWQAWRREDDDHDGRRLATHPAIMDEAYQQHLTGMVALRECVVADLRRKLSEGGVLDQPREGSTPRSAPRRRR